MPVPNTMADLPTLAGSNSPQGSETVFPNLDDYLRSLSAILRSTNAVSSATIAAASTTDLASSSAESVQVTGAATITSLGTGFAGCRREVRFAGACVLTHSASLQLPNAANITTAAGDIIAFRCVASGQWLMVSAARSQLGLVLPLAVASGGTGGTTAAAARTALGAANVAGDTFTGPVAVTGNVSTTNGQFVSSGPAGAHAFRGAGASVSLACDSAGSVLLRPNGAASTAGELSVDSSGNVNIAGTIASREITVSGSSSIHSFTGASNVVIATTGADIIFFRPNGRSSGVNQGAYSSNGNLAIAGTGSGVNWVATSDMRLKDNIVPVDADERLTETLELLNFTWKRDGKSGRSVSAQQVKAARPEYVFEDEEGFLAVDKAGLALETVLGLAKRVQRAESELRRLAQGSED